MHSSSATFVLVPCAAHFLPVMYFIALLCECLREDSRK